MEWPPVQARAKDQRGKMELNQNCWTLLVLKIHLIGKSCMQMGWSTGMALKKMGQLGTRKLVLVQNNLAQGEMVPGKKVLSKKVLEQVLSKKAPDRLEQNKLVANTLELRRQEQVDSKLVLGKLVHKCRTLQQVSASCSSYVL
jgi:hypothetical protein